MTLKSKIKNRILKRQAELDRVIKQSEIAELLEVGETQANSIINGRSYTSVIKTFKLAKFLNCKMDDLYEEKE